MRRLSRPWLLIGSAALAALLLTITRPSPEGLIGMGVGNREVRAAPGQSLASIGRPHNLAALEIVNKTLIRIQEAYVDPSRIDPKAMLFSALDSVQLNIPEVLVKPDPAADTLTVNVNDKHKTFSTLNVDSPWRLSKTLKKIFRFVEINMNPGADLAEVEYAAANGILATLDPHSILMDPEAAAEMRTSTGGGFAGLGIVIGMRNKHLTVIRPMPGTPAFRAGIKARDHIVRINNELTENLTLAESVNRMRGKRGTKVTLFLERKGEASELRFDLARDRITVASVQSKMLSKKVGYFKIKQFSSPTTNETKAALKTLIDAGATSFVMDLRSNPGGLLDQAIRVSDLFVDSGTIVTTVGGSEREAHQAARSNTLTHAPLAILLNSNSASASEIVAGALKNLDRAITIGDTSFGKGSVQILYDNDDLSTLKLTVAEYLTPGDLSIQGLGISPDIKLRRMFVPKKNTEPSDHLRLLPPTSLYRERDLRASLKSRYVNPSKAAPPVAELSFVYQRRTSKQASTDTSADTSADKSANDDPEDEFTFEDSDEIYEDFEIRFARDLISSVGKASRSATLKGVPKALLAPKLAEAKHLREKLSVLGVDWGAPLGASTSKPNLVASFKVQGGTRVIVAGSALNIVGTVRNQGTATAYQVEARMRSSNFGFQDREMIFGKIEPGETRSWTTHFRVRKSASDRVSYVRFETRDASGAKATSAPLRLRVASAKLPEFAYSHQLIDEGNGDGLVQAGERHQIRIRVRNTGKGASGDTVAILRNTSGDALKLEKARFDLGSLAPGESKVVDFMFLVSATPLVKTLGIELQVFDTALGASVGEKLRYNILPTAPGPAPMKGSVRLTQSAKVFEGASNHSEIVAKAATGTVLTVSGQVGNWLRVDLGEGRPGFIARSKATTTDAPPKLDGLVPLMQVTPPVLTLQAHNFETSASTYPLKGSVVDDNKVEDVYVFVSNRDAKVTNRKVFYRSNRGSKKADQMRFEATLPLWKGSNFITVIARESDEVRTARSFYVEKL